MATTEYLRVDPAAKAVSWRGRFAANIIDGLTLLKRRPVRGAGLRLQFPRRTALVVVVLASLVAALALAFDAPLSAAVKWAPDWLLAAANAITHYGRSSVLLWPLAIILVAVAAARAPSLDAMSQSVLAAVAARCGFLFTAIALPSLFVTIVKRLIGRARPTIADYDVYWPLAWRADYASMPSGHAASAFAAAIAIGAVWPWARPILWLYAISIATSRVLVMSHFPSDALAGAVVGGFGALILRNVFARRRIVFAVDAQGCVVAKPGPSWRRIGRALRNLWSQKVGQVWDFDPRAGLR